MAESFPPATVPIHRTTLPRRIRSAAFALALTLPVAACDANGHLAALPTDIVSCISQQCTLGANDIVFTSDRTGVHQIWTMHADGTGARQITIDGSVENWWPRISPDRTRILFYRAPLGFVEDSSRATLWMVNPDGTGLAEVRRPSRDGWTSQGHAEWSPSGQELVMYGGVSSGLQVFVTTRAGAIVRQVTSRAGVGTDVSWAPNGTLLVFNGCSRTPCTPADLEIYQVSAFGGSEARVTTNTRPDYEPQYSPSAGDLAWLQKTGDTGNGGIGTWGIMMRRTADGALRTLIDDGLVNNRPTWSNDGSEIFFPRKDPAASSPWRIFRIALDGTGLRAITSASAGNSQNPGT